MEKQSIVSLGLIQKVLEEERLNVSTQDIYRRNFENYYLNSKVRRCPTCGDGIEARYITHIEIEDIGLVIIYTCPLCDEVIVARLEETFEFSKSGQKGKSCGWEIQSILPNSSIVNEPSSIIKKISPRFCDIYNQSQKAENIGLDEVCGVGYRKALEFLVKDYAISTKKGEEENIKKRPLKQCIDAYIDNPQIKSCVTGAVFIGNDETHYIRKWENKDIRDLKRLIEMTIRWIELIEYTNDIQEDMGV